MKMMTLEIVALRDIKADVWLPPQFVPSIGAYLRQLTNEVNSGNPKNILSTNPHDFEAFHLGSFEDTHGDITTLPNRVSLGQLSNFVVTSN